MPLQLLNFMTRENDCQRRLERIRMTMVSYSDYPNKSSNREERQAIRGERNTWSTEVERETKHPCSAFLNVLKFHQLPLIDDCITLIWLHTNVDDDFLPDMRNHYAIHHPIGPVLGLSPDGLSCVIHKGDDFAIDSLQLQEHPAKSAALSITCYSDIIGKYSKTEKLRDKTQHRYGWLLLYKEPKCP